MKKVLVVGMLFLQASGAQLERKQHQQAITTQQTEATKELLNILTSFNVRSGECSLRFSDLDKIKKAIKQGAHVNSISNPISLLSTRKSLRVEVSPDRRIHSYRFLSRYTPLMLAAYRGLSDVVALLLEHGAEVNQQSKAADGGKNYRDTALILALIGKDLCKVSDEEHLKTIKILLHYNADVNKPDSDGHTPLMFAMHDIIPLSVVKLLLKAGANQSHLDNKGKSAVDYAHRSETKTALLKNFKTMVKGAVQTPVSTRAVGGLLEGERPGTPPIQVPHQSNIRSIIAEYLIGEEPKRSTEKESKRTGGAAAGPSASARK